MTTQREVGRHVRAEPTAGNGRSEANPAHADPEDLAVVVIASIVGATPMTALPEDMGAPTPKRRRRL